MISTFGRHFVAEYHGCNVDVLDDVESVRQIVEAAATTAGATIVQTVAHRFAPQGVSVVVVVEESHLSIHTWPEAGYAAVDFYTCGECDPSLAHDTLVEGLDAQSSETLMLHRGVRTEKRSIHVIDTRREGDDPSVAQDAQ